MKRRLWSLLLALTMVLSLTACQDVGIIGGENGPTDITIGDSVQAGDAQTGGGDAVLPETPEEPAIDEDGTYDSRDEVALYLVDLRPSAGQLHHQERSPGPGLDRRQRGDGGPRLRHRRGPVRQSGGVAAPGVRLPGVRHRHAGERQPGAKRLVYTEDCAYIYYTEDHYESFALLYGEE